MDSSSGQNTDANGGLRPGQFTIRFLFAVTTLVGIVCGFTVWHGSGVVLVILWNAIASLVALVVGRTKRKAAGASLTALFAGWCAAFVAQVVWQVHFGGFGYITDFGFWFYATSVFAFAGWVGFALPAIRLARAGALVYRPLFAVVAGVGLALAAYAVLVCIWVPDAWYIAWFPATIGGVGGALFPFLVRSRCPTYLLFYGPSIAILSFWCLAWPTLEALTPGFTYTYGTPDARVRSLHRMIDSVRVGDSATALQQRYPCVFSGAFHGMSGSGSTERYEYRFGIEVDEKTGLVKHVSSEFRQRQ